MRPKACRSYSKPRSRRTSPVVQSKAILVAHVKSRQLAHHAAQRLGCTAAHGSDDAAAAAAESDAVRKTDTMRLLPLLPLLLHLVNRAASHSYGG
jgi:hypothetical protein